MSIRTSFQGKCIIRNKLITVTNRQESKRNSLNPKNAASMLKQKPRSVHKSMRIKNRKSKHHIRTFNNSILTNDNRKDVNIDQQR